MNRVFKGIFEIATNRRLFRMIYLLISLAFVTFVSEISFLSVINKLVIMWGVLLIPYTLYKRFINRKGSIKLYEIAIVAFLTLTLVLNVFNYFTTENLKIWLINNIYFIVLFLPDYKTSLKECEKEIHYLSIVYSIVSFITSSISIFMLYSGTIYTTASKVIYTNVFSNENSLGLSAALACVISIYLLLDNKKSVIKKSTLLINAIVQICAVLYSGGRSAYIIFIALIFILVFVKFKNIFFRASIIIAPISLFGIVVYKNINTLYLLLTGREILWGTAFKLIKEVPFTGVGNTELVPRIRALTYEELLGIEGGGLHNIYIQTAAVNGIVASIILILIVLGIFLYVLKRYDNLENNSKNKFIPVFSIFIAIPLISMMESTMIYNISFISIIFWVYTSYLCTYVHEKNRN